METSARQGFSVSYGNKLLYSKFSPQKAVLQMIENLEILDGTVFLCFSPVLGYGIRELAKKIESKGFKNCILFLIEAEKNLYDFAVGYWNEILGKFNSEIKIIPVKNEEISFIQNYLWYPESVSLSKIKIPNPGTFRRVVSLQMSAGFQISKSIYDECFSRCQNIISTFWKNRITLVKLGRLYSKNFFANYRLIEKTEGNKIGVFNDFEGFAEKNILVLGAGPSVNETLEKLASSGNRENFLVVAVDAALPILKAYGINCDFLVAVESQLAVEKCYVGSMCRNAVVFSDLTSRPSLNKKLLKNNAVSFFASSYTESVFFNRFRQNKILPCEISPMGSVGLTAVEIALKLRKSEDVKIFVSGLDFSYPLGFTHGKGSAQESSRFHKKNRIASEGSLIASFKNGAECIEGKNGIKVYSDKVLLSYAANFSQIFGGKINLFDVGKTGVNLGLSYFDNWENEICRNENLCQCSFGDLKKSFGSSCNGEKFKENVKSFLESEKNSLLEIKNLLIEGKTENFVPESRSQLIEKLQKEIECREYLFLHFPDGHSFDANDISFLKRIRSEIDWILKILL